MGMGLYIYSTRQILLLLYRCICAAFAVRISFQREIWSGTRKRLINNLPGIKAISFTVFQKAGRLFNRRMHSVFRNQKPTPILAAKTNPELRDLGKTFISCETWIFLRQATLRFYKVSYVWKVVALNESRFRDICVFVLCKWVKWWRHKSFHWKIKRWIKNISKNIRAMFFKLVAMTTVSSTLKIWGWVNHSVASGWIPCEHYNQSVFVFLYKVLQILRKHRTHSCSALLTQPVCHQQRCLWSLEKKNVLSTAAVNMDQYLEVAMIFMLPVHRI